MEKGPVQGFEYRLNRLCDEDICKDYAACQVK